MSAEKPVWNLCDSAPARCYLVPSCARKSAGQTSLAPHTSYLQRRTTTALSQAFERGIAQHPENAGAHKDLAYTLLKTGKNVEARDQFEAAMRLNARDDTAALEYAFLCYDTRKPIEARRTFDKLRKHGLTPATRCNGGAGISEHR